MMQRLVTLCPSIRRVLLIPRNTEHSQKLISLDEEEKVKDLVEALQVFQCVTNTISGEKFFTMSLVMPSIVLNRKQVN